MAPPNWNTAEQIRDHRLAASVINGHGNDRNAVFDEPSLEKLKAFVEDPSLGPEMIKAYGWDDESAESARRDLVGLLVARHGTQDPAFDERDLEMLREWFKKGMPAGQNVER